MAIFLTIPCHTCGHWLTLEWERWLQLWPAIFCRPCRKGEACRALLPLYVEEENEFGRGNPADYGDST